MKTKAQLLAANRKQHKKATAKYEIAQRKLDTYLNSPRAQALRKAVDEALKAANDLLRVRSDIISPPMAPSKESGCCRTASSEIVGGVIFEHGYREDPKSW